MATILERQRRQLQQQRPLYERIQDWIFAWDIGMGVQFFRIGIFRSLSYRHQERTSSQPNQSYEVNQVRINFRLHFLGLHRQPKPGG